MSPNQTDTSNGSQHLPPPQTPLAAQGDDDVTTSPSLKGAGIEQALESHEVIELQTFSERKAWIEEKIKLLENMPPIEVFVGLDAIGVSAEQVPGLPTRDELQQWILEHDAIEKETEVFDTGELKKLRQLTKAATQRNLSPEDTDVIELTLTTIYELDKLLHLLRDRSENLELLGIRLTWEDSRIGAWIDRRKLVDDLHEFLQTRARWNPQIYETSGRGDDAPNFARRGSVNSLASVTSELSIVSPSFSRSARFKLAELLSRDAALLAGRVTSLRHGKIAAAGKALDKLIDTSRKAVPEVLLDEQDRLEEKGIHDMEHVGKFAMNVVMQWRKADEVYIETMKDQIAAQNLLEEVETAKLHHPTSRQSSSFLSRIETLSKRLSLRGNPTSFIHSFPRPEHPLFPEQKESNDDLVQKLSLEVEKATKLVQLVATAAQEYRTRLEAVKRVENLLSSANEMSSTFVMIIQQLMEGVPDGHGDGAVPDLTVVSCLEPTRHSVFLALLPSIQERHHSTDRKSEELIFQSKHALFGLDFPGISPEFKAGAVSGLQKLSSLREQAQTLQEDVLNRVVRLKEARRVWSQMDKCSASLEDLRLHITVAMNETRWRQETGGTGPPPTPESPLSVIVSTQNLPVPIKDQISRITKQLTDDIGVPLDVLSRSLETALKDYLLRGSADLKWMLNSVRQLSELLDSIQNQTSVMNSIREEFNGFRTRIEDLKLSMNSKIVDDSNESDQQRPRLENGTSFSEQLKCIQKDVTTFIDGLSSRIPFVSRYNYTFNDSTSSSRRRILSSNFQLGLTRPTTFEVPIDLTPIDAAVRADSNYFAMRLSGELDSIVQLLARMELVRLSNELDDALVSVNGDITNVSHELIRWNKTLSDIEENHSNALENLDLLLDIVEVASSRHRIRISGSILPLKGLLERMDTTSAQLDPSDRNSLLAPRVIAVSDVELRLKAWEEGVASIQSGIVQARQLEVQRLEDVRLAYEMEKAEEARLTELEAEKRRLEARLAEELREHQERERLAQAEAERLLLEQQIAEAEERTRLENEEKMRLEQSEREEQLRVAHQEQIRLDREERLRLEREEKLRLEREEQLLLESKNQIQEDEEPLLGNGEQLQNRQGSEQKTHYKWPTDEADEQENQLHKTIDWSETQTTVQGVTETPLPDDVQPRADTDLNASKSSVLDVGGTQSPSLEDENLFGDFTSHEIDNRPPTLLLKAFELQPVNRPPETDVFGLVRSQSSGSKSQEVQAFQGQILSLRRRLRSLCLSDFLQPMKLPNLPSKDQFNSVATEFSSLMAEVSRLPSSLPDESVNIELSSLRMEMNSSSEILKQVEALANTALSVIACDAALSDLLEHIDSYPALPIGDSSSSFVAPIDKPPEGQLAARLAFTTDTVRELKNTSKGVESDPRVSSELSRTMQAWSELEEMGNDRLETKKSRPTSAVSSNSSRTNDTASTVPPISAKKAAYANLSASSSSRTKLLAPPNPGTRRVVSASNDKTNNRSMSRMSSVSSSRSVSGPLNFSIQGSTFSSRQRTTSLSTSNSPVTPVRNPPNPIARIRTRTGQSSRSGSPSVSEASFSRFQRASSRASVVPTSSWSRAPRNSLSSILPRVTSPPTPQRPKPAPRKKYIADPKSKLDVAVGDVVNQLPVGINVEGVSETWKDQSGKYWIGNQDPKLCFCRILRSQTVMVRVGGGWTELSKFIKDHFAESFRLLPESPPRPGAQEEKWINSATLLESANIDVSQRPLITPEPAVPFIPSLSLLTPSGQSPHSILSTPSAKGSPLHPMQFIRRAEPEPVLLRPSTPSKNPLRGRNTPTPVRNSIWRP